ncbi:MAG TPA: DUF3352 domain-containing protein [Anaerolineales bacterium]|nr:DUF3352 domain-containing protein [Anaerolineales bacterium]HLO31424.1 DUF3352 domain-containing protein [Anaerolineales bacterium]
MNESNEAFTPQESPGVENPVPEKPIETAPPAPEKPKGIPKIAWIAGCGCLLLGACVAVAALFMYFGFPLFGGDPIASIVPNDSTMYMGVDLAQTQSQNFNDIVAVAQELADADQNKTMAESLDKFLGDELNMSFTQDVMPWIGRHGALVITDANFANNTYKMMFIVESRNKAKADQFISKFTAALEVKQNRKFTQSEKDGITYYVYKSDSDYEQDVVMARDSKFVYLSNSQDVVSKSINLQKKDSLSGLTGYKDALAALPKKRLATFYMSGEAVVDSFTNVFNQASGLSSPYIKDLATKGLSGMAMSLSVEDEGLRMDAATVYDETKLSEYQKEALATKYLKPTTDALVPEDTFFFLGVNSSKSLSSYTKIDNPLYSSDVKESFDLLNKQYGINVQDLLDVLSGEIAMAIGPADDGLFAQTGNVNMGITVLAGTSDEKGFNDWFGNVLETAFSQGGMSTGYDISDAQIGEYKLKELTIKDSSQSVSALIYGADNNYIVLGSSQSMLESGLTGTKNLTNNEIYHRTWAAFPAGSVPYMYLNVKDLMNFLVDNADEFGGSDVSDAQKRLRNIPIVAVSLNNTTGYVRGTTLIIFIDKNK